MKKSHSVLDARIDYALILPVFLLSIIGFIALFVSLHADHPAQATSLLWQQAAWLIVGMVMVFFVMHLDSQMLWDLAPILYGFGLLLMILPLFMYSPALYAATGSKNWIAINGSSLFQPSEFMKVVYILFLARLIVNYRSKLKVRYVRSDLEMILRMFLATLPIIFLLVGPHMQNDFGTMLVFLAIFAGMILVSGVSWKILLPIILLSLIVISVIVYIAFSPNSQHILDSMGFKVYQSARFEAWAHPFSDPTGSTYQQAQAQTTIGVGGVYGLGSSVTKIPVPVRESDMIFTVIAGGSGFIGATFVIFLYLYLIYRMIRITFKTKSQFYVFIATGLTMMLTFHVFENIGAAIGVVPLTGIPLPFLSQGGSNLISNMIGVGLILSIRFTSLPNNKKSTREKYQKKLDKRQAKNQKRNLA